MQPEMKSERNLRPDVMISTGFSLFSLCFLSVTIFHVWVSDVPPRRRRVDTQPPRLEISLPPPPPPRRSDVSRSQRVLSRDPSPPRSDFSDFYRVFASHVFVVGFYDALCVFFLQG